MFKLSFGVNEVPIFYCLYRGVINQLNRPLRNSSLLSVIVLESVPEVENVGRPILMKLAPEVGLIEIFQKPSWFCSLTFS